MTTWRHVAITYNVALLPKTARAIMRYDAVRMATLLRTKTRRALDRIDIRRTPPAPRTAVP